MSGSVLAWLSVWGEVQICIWPSWHHCHSLSLAPGNPDWFWFYLSGTGNPGSPGQNPHSHKMVVVEIEYNTVHWSMMLQQHIYHKYINGLHSAVTFTTDPFIKHLSQQNCLITSSFRTSTQQHDSNTSIRKCSQLWLTASRSSGHADTYRPGFKGSSAMSMPSSGNSLKHFSQYIYLSANQSTV